MRTVALEDVCEINVGRTPARNDGSLWGLGQPWLSIADMNQGNVIRNTKEQITSAGAAKGRPVNAGTVLLSFKLSIGKVAIAGVPLYTNEAIAALPVRDPDRLDERFLMRALESMDLARGSSRAAMGATLNKAKLRQIQVPLPPLDEQRRIAAILDYADALRAKRRQVLAHLDDLTQSIFHETLHITPYEELAAGELMPAMRNGVSPATAGEDQATVLTLSAVTGRRFDPEAAKSAFFSANPPPEKRVSSRDFLMCRGNGNKNLVGVGTFSREDRSDLVFPDTVIAGRVDTSRVLMEVLELAWRQRQVRHQIEAVARTTNGTFKVNQKSLASIRLQLPRMPAQKEMVERLQAVSAQAERVDGMLTLADEVFASLQSRAFRGEL